MGPNYIVQEDSTVVQLLTLSCLETSCMAKLRIGRFLKEPATHVGAMSFCPMCGGKAYQHYDSDESYWETLSRAYELPVFLVKQIHSVWDSSVHPRFGTFVDEMKKESELVK